MAVVEARVGWPARIEDVRFIEVGDEGPYELGGGAEREKSAAEHFEDLGRSKIGNSRIAICGVLGMEQAEACGMNANECARGVAGLVYHELMRYQSPRRLLNGRSL